MTAENNLLASCKYYKKESENPFQTNSMNAQFWDVERAWFRDVMNEADDILSFTLDSFIYSPCYEPTRLLDIPIGILSYLYAYYSKHDEMVHIDEFGEFLKKYQKNM